MILAFRLFLFFFLYQASSWASETVSPWYTQNPDKQVTLYVDLFLSSTCPHCRKTETFFNKISASTPYVQVQRHIINEDKEALLRFHQLLMAQHMDDFAVPSVYICNSRWVGFASEETTGKDLMRAINYCKQQIEKEGRLTTATVNTLQHWANANKFDAGMVEHPPAFKYIIMIAGIDAFSPCAFFCFAAFLAFIFIGKSRREQLIAGILFIVAVAFVHYFQQVYTSAFYNYLPWLRIPALAVGGSAVYFIYKKQVHRYSYWGLAFLFGLMVTAYQQTCVMNWSYIFEQWLHNQQISTLQIALYQLFYQILYVLPLVLILVVYLALLKIKRFASWQPRFRAIGLLFLFVLALCLIFYPALLSHMLVSLFALLILTVCGRFLNLA